MKQDMDFGKPASSEAFAPASGEVFAPASLGGFMVLMGVIFWLGTSGVTFLGLSAWWLIALLPVYWIVTTAYRLYRHDGRLSRRVAATLIWALLPFAYIGAGALGYSVSALWPLGIILTGITFLMFSTGKYN